MAVSMTLSATSYSITANIGGLSSEHEYNRRFTWYLDGVLKTTQIVPPGSTTHSYTIQPVYFGSTHKVKCEIADESGSEVFATLNGSATTGYADVDLWRWDRSNGTATALQTSAAHTALSSMGLTSNMNYRVWNDLTNKIYYLITHSGIVWNGAPPVSLQSRGILSASEMNKVVENIGYPVWSWRDDPSSTGYLGRLNFKGVSQYGKNSDYVLGSYILELVKNLNIMIRIYTDGEGLTYLSSGSDFNIVDAAKLNADRSISLSCAEDIIVSLYAALEAKRKSDLISATLLSIVMDATISKANSIISSSATNFLLGDTAIMNASESEIISSSVGLNGAIAGHATMSEETLLLAAMQLSAAVRCVLEAKTKYDLEATGLLSLSHLTYIETSTPSYIKAHSAIKLSTRSSLKKDSSITINDSSMLRISNNAQPSFQTGCALNSGADLALSSFATMELKAAEWHLPQWITPYRLYVPQSKEVYQAGVRVSIS